MSGPTLNSTSEGGGRLAGARWLLAGRFLALLALLVLVLPAAPAHAGHPETHLHTAGQVHAGVHAAVSPDASAPSPDAACGLQPCHACGCHAVMAVADPVPPALPQPGLTVLRPAAEFGEPRATAPPRRPPRA